LEEIAGGCGSPAADVSFETWKTELGYLWPSCAHGGKCRKWNERTLLQEESLEKREVVRTLGLQEGNHSFIIRRRPGAIAGGVQKRVRGHGSKA